MIIVMPSFSKSFVFKMFSVYMKTKSWRFTNSSGLKDIYAKLRFCQGLVWTVGLTVEINLRFQIPPAYCGRNLEYNSLTWAI